MSDDLLAVVRKRARSHLFWRHLGIEVDALDTLRAVPTEGVEPTSHAVDDKEVLP